MYAWHVLPHDVYARNKRALLDKDPPNAAMTEAEFRETAAFDLLTDGEARVVVNCT